MEIENGLQGEDRYGRGAYPTTGGSLFFRRPWEIRFKLSASYRADGAFCNTSEKLNFGLLSVRFPVSIGSV